MHHTMRTLRPSRFRVLTVRRQAVCAATLLPQPIAPDSSAGVRTCWVCRSFENGPEDQTGGINEADASGAFESARADPLTCDCKPVGPATVRFQQRPGRNLRSTRPDWTGRPIGAGSRRHRACFRRLPLPVTGAE